MSFQRILYKYNVRPTTCRSNPQSPPFDGVLQISVDPRASTERGPKRHNNWQPNQQNRTHKKNIIIEKLSIYPFCFSNSTAFSVCCVPTSFRHFHHLRQVNRIERFVVYLRGEPHPNAKPKWIGLNFFDFFYRSELVQPTSIRLLFCFPCNFVRAEKQLRTKSQWKPEKNVRLCNNPWSDIT